MQPMNGQQGPRQTAPRQGGQRRVLVRRKPGLQREPSRLAFRLQRLWLTPFVRSVTRIGAPIFVLTLAAGLWFGDQGRRADFLQWVDDTKVEFQNRPEFRVSDLKVEGASPEVSDAIRMMLPVQLPASSFVIDLESYHDAIERLDAVKSAAVIVRSGALEVKVTEREPVILWRTPSGVEMLDVGGHRVASLTRRDARPDLPLIAGEGADKAVPEALEVLSAALPILPKIRGLVRMGERRWDIDLADNRRIMLPEKNPVRAVEKVLALNRSDDLLARDFAAIDLRYDDRPVVRLTAYALEQFQVVTGQIVADRKTAPTKVSATPTASATAPATAPAKAASTTPRSVTPVAAKTQTPRPQPKAPQSKPKVTP